MKINAVPVFLLACSLGALAVWNAGRHRSYRQRAMPIVDASGTLVAAMKARSELLKAVTRGRSRPPLTVRSVPYQPENSTASKNDAFNGLVVEELEYLTEVEPSAQWVPLRVVAPDLEAVRPLPAVIILHATGGNLQAMAGYQARYARKGYLTAAIDTRYHGKRAVGADPRSVYQAALVRAWRDGVERPFLLDTVWDLQGLLGYLEEREDVDSSRVGMMGISLGGMHTWLTAALDPRVRAAAPMIGVQYFGWAVDNDSWQARVASIPDVFDAAAADLGKQAVDAETVRAVWDRLLPGLLSSYDAPFSLPAIAPRPLLIANGEKDPRCPIRGVQAALPAAQTAYEELGAGDKLELFVQEGQGHAPSPALDAAIATFLDKHLLG